PPCLLPIPFQAFADGAGSGCGEGVWRSCGPQDVLNGGGYLLVLVEFPLELFESFLGEGIETNLAAGFGFAGFRFDPAFEQHALEGGIEGALFGLENGAGKFADTLSDCVAV